MNSLKRYPVRPRELLQAWDSADELLLKFAEGQDLTGKRVLVLNDSFGALAVGLKADELSVYSDSYVSGRAIHLNSAGKITAFHDLNNLHGKYDYVFYRIPKNLSFFEDQLCRLSAHLSETSVVVGAAMIKHLAKGAFDLLEKYLGKTQTSLAEKKARLVFAKVEKPATATPYPLQVKIEGYALPFTHESNLFSREKLDIGTRFFLEHIPSGPFRQILDLGCANGIVGIKAKQKNPQAKILFSDDSAMAIASAKTNYARNFADDAGFYFTNCFENQPENSVDLVLCNPPFHQAQTLGDHIAQQMFKDSFHALLPGGRLRVVGNTHLFYAQKLKSIFSNCQIIATHPKFVVTESVKKP